MSVSASALATPKFTSLPSSASRTSCRVLWPEATSLMADAVLRTMFHRKNLARYVRISASPSSETSMESIVTTVGFPSVRQNLAKSCSPTKSSAHSLASSGSNPSDGRTYLYSLDEAWRG